jgi:nucleoside-diphosphate-sugar epimerase
MKVVITGANGLVGRRTAARLAQLDHAVVAIDRTAMPAPLGVPAGALTPRQVDLSTADLAAELAGADAVVHLATTFPADAASLEPSAADLALTRRVLDAAASAGAGQVVLVSSTMVYGAWPNNPVPLTEDAPLRPNSDFAFAVHKAELERRALDWRADHPAVSVAILRPTTVVAEHETGKVDQLLRSAGGIRTEEGDPPAQYLHADDLAEAIVVAVQSGLDGVVNVAPDGWIAPGRLRALAFGTPRLRVPSWVARAFVSWRWRTGLASAPPGLVAYTTYPWVVANDRLRALGWQAANTNEEAFVAGHDPLRTDRLTARRKQQLSLGMAGGAVAGTIGTAIALALRARRRR